MSNIDEQFVEFIVKSLVSNPDDVKITRTIDEKGVLLELEVAGDDLGRVIGKRGATAQSIRTLLRALGTKNDARYNLKIVDTGEGTPPPPRERRKEEEKTEEAPAAEAEEAPEETVEEVADEPDTSVDEDDMDDDDEEEEEEDSGKSFADKARADLDDLDDLDI